MAELLFCDRCGKVSSASIDKIGGLCSQCGVRECRGKKITETGGHYVGVGVGWYEAQRPFIKEYEAAYDGKSPKESECNEYLREKYFYGKLDNNVDKESATERRKDELYRESPEYMEKRSHEDAIEYQQRHNINTSSSNVPKCPACGSANLTKLSAVGKVAKIKLFGIFGAGSLGKTYKCNNCGIKF